MAQGILGVCFDLGGTVIDDSGIPATQELAALLHVDLPTMRNYLHSSKCSREEPLLLASRIAEDFGNPASTTLICETLERRRHAVQYPTYFPDAMPTILELRRRGYRIATLSNVLGAIAPPASWNPLAGIADVALLSCDIGTAKPDSAAFNMAAAALDLPSAQLLHVGDSLAADVDGAQAAGWHAIHLVRKDTEAVRKTTATAARSAPVIGNLGALLDLLEPVTSTATVVNG